MSVHECTREQCQEGDCLISFSFQHSKSYFSLVNSGSQDKIPYTEQVKWWKLIFSQFWRLQVQEQGQDQDQDHGQFHKLLSWLCFHQMAVHLPWRDRGRENCLMSLFIRTLISSWGSYLMIISSKPNCLPKAPSPVASILRCRVSTHEFWRYTVESIAPLAVANDSKRSINIHWGTEMSPGLCQILWAL